MSKFLQWIQFYHKTYGQAQQWSIYKLDTTLSPLDYRVCSLTQIVGGWARNLEAENLSSQVSVCSKSPVRINVLLLFLLSFCVGSYRIRLCFYRRGQFFRWVFWVSYFFWTEKARIRLFTLFALFYRSFSFKCQLLQGSFLSSHSSIFYRKRLTRMFTTVLGKSSEAND